MPPPPIPTSGINYGVPTTTGGGPSKKKVPKKYGPLPTTIDDFYRQRFSNPDNIKEITDHPTGPEALFYQAYLADNEYRAKGEKQLKDTLGVYHRGREMARKQLDGAEGSALSDASRGYLSAQGNVNEDAVGRGIYGTTVAQANTRRESERFDRTKSAIRSDYASRRVGVEGAYTDRIASTVGGVNYAAPSYQLIADALRAKLTPTGSGSSGVANIFQGAMGGASAGAAGGPWGALIGAGIGAGAGAAASYG